MRTESKEIKIYSYDDVKNDIDGIQEKVVSKWNVFMDGIINEINASLAAYKESINHGPGCNHETGEEITGLRLRTWIINNYLPILEKGKYYSTRGHWIEGQYFYKHRRSNINIDICCPFTGICYDMDFIDNIIKFIKEPNYTDTWEDLTEGAEEIANQLYNDEYEYRTSTEAILEDIEANDYEFGEDGNIY